MSADPITLLYVQHTDTGAYGGRQNPWWYSETWSGCLANPFMTLPFLA